MRLNAFRELKIPEVMVSVVPAKTEALKLKYALSDNERMAYYNEQELAELVQINKTEIELSDYKIDLGEPTGLEDLLQSVGPGQEVVEDEPPPVPKTTKIKTGDLFQLGNHKLLCGDSTNKENINKLVGKQKINMIFTDPPYNVGFDYNSYDDKLDDKEWFIFCEKWFNIAKNVSPYITFTPGQGNVYIFHSICNELHTLTWHKKFSLSNGYISYAVVCEPVLVYGKPLKRYNTDYFNFGTDMEKDLLEKHPYPKPIQLISELIQPAIKENENVLDLFGGSGSTIIACEQLNRKCFMIELDPIYCDVIIDRWENFTGKKVKKIN